MNSAQERYAFIALLFLVVVVSVVAFWDDGDGQDPVQAASRDDAVHVDPGAYAVDPGATDPRPWDAAPASGGLAAETGSIALAGLDEDVPVLDPVSTRGQSYADHAQAPRDGLRDAGRDAYLAGADPYGDDPYGDDSIGDGQGAAFEDDRAPVSSEPMRPTRGDSLALSGAGERRPMRLSRDETVNPPAARESVAPVPAPVTAAPAGSSATRDYVVRAGDVLSTIASRECGTASLVNEIVRLNGLSNPDKIFEGMKLQLPA
ncbi:MAG: LysM peptidoglycan-binding domain-containing protein, partial [Planctomycetota bacterium]